VGEDDEVQEGEDTLKAVKMLKGEFKR